MNNDQFKEENWRFIRNCKRNIIAFAPYQIAIYGLNLEMPLTLLLQILLKNAKIEHTLCLCFLPKKGKRNASKNHIASAKIMSDL